MSDLGILQARRLEWAAIFFSNACMHACMLSHFSHVRCCATPWTAAHKAPLSTGVSRQESWSGLPVLLQSDSLGPHAISQARILEWVAISFPDNATSNINNNSKRSAYNCLNGITQFLNTVCDNIFNPYSRLM